MPTVLITNAVPPDIIEPLQQMADVILGPGGGDIMPRSDVLMLAGNLDAIINQGELKVDSELLGAAPQLKIVANVAAGYNNLDLDWAAGRSSPVRQRGGCALRM